MTVLKIIGVLAALALVAVPVVPLVLGGLRPVGRRFAAFMRHSPLEGFLLAAGICACVVYGSTKGTAGLYREGYSGVYDGKPHGVTVEWRNREYVVLDSIIFSRYETGPYVFAESPTYTDAGTYTVYYSVWTDFGTFQYESLPVTITPKRLTEQMVGEIPAQTYTGAPLEPAVDVADGDILTTNDYVVSYSNNIDLGTATVTVSGTNNYCGTVTRTFAVTVPFGGTVTPPKSVKAGARATWTAKARSGSVFAGWSGPAVAGLGLSENQLRNPRLTLVVPTDFRTEDLSASFIALEDDGLHALSLGETNLAYGVQTTFPLLHDSRSLVTASVAGLPPGLAFDRTRLLVKGKPTKPGIYVVKIAATNASGYAWSENVAVRVRDRVAEGFIDFSGMPAEATRGQAYSGTLVTDLRGYVKVQGLPEGLTFYPRNGTVKGRPKKAGVSVVTVVQTFLNGIVKVATHTMTVRPWSVPKPVRTPHRALTLVCPAAQGRVAGGGVYPEGRTVKITATPAAGLVFAGWYRDGLFTQPLEDASADYRSRTLTVKIAGARRLFARFVPVAEAVESLAVTLGGKPADATVTTSVPVGVRLNIPLVAEALSTTKVTVSGLPAGLTYDAASGMIVGVPTRAVAAQTVTVKVTVAGKTLTRRLTFAASGLPVWARGAIFSGGGTVNGVAGLSTLTVATTGRISGKIVTAAGTAWTFAASGFAERSDWGTYRARVTVRRGKKTYKANLWVWADELAEGRQIGHYELEQISSGITLAAEGWQCAFLRSDLADIVPSVQGRTWSLDVSRGSFTLKAGAKGALTARGRIDGVAVTAGARLLLTDWNDRGEPDWRTTVRFAAKGKPKFRGLVWTGRLGGADDSPANVVTTTEDVVDPDDGVVSLREALAASDEIGFNLPVSGDLRCVLGAPLEFSTSKTIDGRVVGRVRGQSVTNRVAISGGGAVRLFAGTGQTAGITFRNLVLEDGYAGPAGLAPETCGGVVQAVSWGTVTFENCLVRNNRVEGNGAVVDWYGPVIMTNSTFAGNRAEHMGGVVCLNSASDSAEGGVTATDCTFEDNDSGTAGGVFRVDSGCRASGCVFRGNACARGGGVIWGSGSYWLTGCLLEANVGRGYRGGAISVYASSSTASRVISVTDSVFRGNAAAQGNPNIDSTSVYHTVDTTGTVFDLQTSIFNLRPSARLQFMVYYRASARRVPGVEWASERREGGLWRLKD